jgi:3-hydroxyacyl-CoA dehydrogenase/enoyl-CoA hydratase/3-hydroxybutyryl-CoA epimerase
MLKHWKLTRDNDGIAWLAFDRAAATTNTFSTEALVELRQAIEQLRIDPPKGLAILSAKENGFAAGADIEEFTRMRDADEAWRFITLGNEVFDLVEALGFPTVALIHGFCMGGGTELALACKYRVADDSPKTRMSLPEVMIGIVPGWGGAKRLPRLVGAAPALDLMLTGRGVDGKRAKRMGLVDAVTPRRQFENAARRILMETGRAARHLSPPPSLVGPACARSWRACRRRRSPSACAATSTRRLTRSSTSGRTSAATCARFPSTIPRRCVRSSSIRRHAT